MSKTLVTQSDTSNTLPSLYGETPDIQDLTTSSIYLIQDMSVMARERIAFPGSVVRALGSDDVDPTFLINSEEDPKGTFDAYIIGRDRFVCRSEQGSDIEWLPKHYQRQDHERDVWVGYFYYLAQPDIDPNLPARIMLWRTAGRPVFQKLNYYLATAQANGETSPIRVQFSVVQRTGQKSGQKYYALAPKQIAPDPKHKEIVDRQAAMVTALNSRFAGSGEVEGTPELPPF